jgi:hypothetical protein
MNLILAIDTWLNHKKIEQNYVVKVIQNKTRRLEKNVFMFDRKKTRKISDTAIHLIKRLNDLFDGLITGKKITVSVTVTVRNVTVWYGKARNGTKNSRLRAKNKTFTVNIYIYKVILLLLLKSPHFKLSTIKNNNDYLIKITKHNSK